MDPVHALHQALGDVGHAQADGPVGVTLQSDHLVRTETQHRYTAVVSGSKQTNKQTTKRQRVYLSTTCL